MVNVRSIAEMGACVSLLEYNNIEGMILLSELSSRRIRSINKLIRIGRNECVVVIRVDKEKGYIDLSKGRVSPEEAIKCEDKFTKSKTVYSILRHVAEAMAVIKEKMEKRGVFSVQMKPKVVTDTDETELARQLERLERENAEVDGDDDAEEMEAKAED
ncbi:hypothetical protein STEG23_035358 [Scotinomys teguina]